MLSMHTMFSTDSKFHPVSNSTKLHPLTLAIHSWSITQLVAGTILVTVVHPLAHPKDGHRGRVLCIIYEHLIQKNMNSSVHVHTYAQVTPSQESASGVAACSIWFIL